VSGLYGINPGNLFGQTFGVRGFWSLWPGKVIFLVNGVKQIDPYHNTYALQTFDIPVEAIDRIEVVRGPMSVIYGSGAFFGAINIKTNESTEGKAVSMVSASYGSEKTSRVAVRAAGQTSDFNYSFNAGLFDTYGPNESYDKMVSNVSALAGYGITSANASTDGRMERKTSVFNFSGTYKGFHSISVSPRVKTRFP